MKMSNEEVNPRPLSRMVESLAPSGIRKFFDIAAQMQDVISLSVGEPDFATPWSICEAAYASMKAGHTNYTSNSGMPELRRAIAKHLEDLYGIRYGENEILATVVDRLRSTGVLP